MSVEQGKKFDIRQDAGFIYGIFKSELMGYCAQAQLAFDAFQEGIDAHREQHAWFGAQAVLTTAANASKLLWAPKDSEEGAAATEGRRMLREAAKVSEDSPLHRRSVRNALEHIDERIIAWVKQGGTRFGTRSVDWGEGDEFFTATTAKFGVIVARRCTVEFRDQEPVSLVDVADEFARVLSVLRPF